MNPMPATTLMTSLPSRVPSSTAEPGKEFNNSRNRDGFRDRSFIASVGLRNRKETTRQLTARGNIWTAAFHGDATAVRELVTVRSLSMNSIRALGQYCKQGSQDGYLKVVKIFVSMLTNLNIQGGRLHSPLQAAAYSGEIEIVRPLLACGVDVNATGDSCENDRRRTLLHEAVSYGQPQLAKSLLERGVPVKLSDIDGWTALHHASLNGHDEFVGQLLNKDADVSICDMFAA
ncbi:MAG: hypothetical protein Q9212_006589, partial [Teloschistes hypoglaucus]